MDEKVRKSEPNPYTKAGLFSKTFIFFISPLLTLGKSRPLQEDDMPDVCPTDDSQMLTEQLEKEWEKEKKKKSPSFAKILFRIHWLDLLGLTFLVFIEETIKILLPLCITRMVKYFDGTAELKEVLMYAVLISMGVLVNCVTHHPYFLNMLRIGLRIRVAMSGLIYKKIFRLTSVGFDNNTSGKLINMLSTDCTSLENAVLFLPYLIISPLEVLFVIILIINTVDITVLSGSLVIFIALPCQALLGKLFDHMRRITSKKCDRRINLLNEILNGIKIIKMYCWEEPFRNIVQTLRDKELKYQKNLFIVTGFNHIIEQILTSSITFTSVTVFIFFTSLPLLPSYLVLTMSYYMSLSSSIIYFFTQEIIVLIGASVSNKRIKEFLLKEETTQINKLAVDEAPRIRVKSLNSSWSKEKAEFALKDLNFEVNQNELTAVIGSVGSGKTSLLLTLLEELHIDSGELDVKGSVFYVPQEPWIFTATIRQNILFGKPYDAEKFDKVIKTCCLDQDMKMFSDGELTIVGEKGINLSGGQRARVNLARALYSEAQIYLFDDPLSAVDASVAKNIYENCIRNYLSDKIRVLVTHHVHLLTNVNQILYMESGSIKFKGPYSELNRCQDIHLDELEKLSIKEQEEESEQKPETTAKEYLRQISRKSSVDLEQINGFIQSESPVSSSNENVSKPMIESLEILDKEATSPKNEYEEKKLSGMLSWKTYVDYFREGGGFIGTIGLLFIYLACQFLVVAADYWLSYWASKEAAFTNRNISEIMSNETESIVPANQTAFPNRANYYKIYCAILAGMVTFASMKAAIFFTLCIRSSRNLHHKMFSKILCTFIRFFDTNPLGRIINRFSKDIGILDETIPMTVLNFMHVSFLVLGSVCLSIYINKWIIFTLVPLIILLVYIRRYFLASSTEVKRIEGINRSPIYVHVNNTLSGLVSIKAARMDATLNKEFFVHTDYHTRAVTTFLFINRWFGSRLDWIATFYTIITIFGCILLKDFLSVNSGEVGIMLVYSIRLVGLFQWAVRQSCEVENLMTAVERIFEYIKLDIEKLEEGEKKPNRDWPTRGQIIFQNVTFKYERNLPPVLKNLSFRIESGEKVGIVGRTGAGKSSIVQTLFRMAEPEGDIFIDDVNIKEISLHDLRKKLSIIPQEPTLFIGTIRSNLDPFNEYSDDVLWDSLEKVQMKPAVKEMSEGLESEVKKGGSNLSVGQKQLICLARAIIKKSKILIIDEATANVDFKTDSMIQETIKECFKNCTVLTIAHRLRTIIDSDRIMCLSKGKIENFGRPHDLLMDSQTIFHQLVFSLEKDERDSLVQMAKESDRSNDERRVPAFYSKMESPQNEASSERDPLIV